MNISGTTPEQLQAEEGEGPNQTPPVGDSNSGGGASLSIITRTRPTRRDNRPSTAVSATQKEFKGAAPDIGGFLVLRSENVTLKTNFDKFCEKLMTYIISEFKGGEHVIDVVKKSDTDVLDVFKNTNKTVRSHE